MESIDKLSLVALKAQIDEIRHNEHFFIPLAECLFVQYDHNQSGYISIDDYYKCIHTLNEFFKVPSIDKYFHSIEGECLSKEEYKYNLYKLLSSISHSIDNIIK